MDSVQAAISCFIFHADTRKSIRSVLRVEDIQDEFDVQTYKVCLDLDDSHNDFDYLLVVHQLKSRDQWDATKFATRYSEPCSAALARCYAEAAHLEAARREVEAQLLKLAMPDSRELSVSELLGRINDVQEEAARRLSRRQEDGDEVSRLVDDFWEKYEEARDGQASEFETPWDNLNEMIGGGLKRGELAIVGARPGDGKTHCGLNLVNHYMQQYKTWYISLEMPMYPLMCRLAAMNINIAHRTIRNGKLNEEQGDQLRYFMDEYSRGNGRIIQRMKMSYRELEALVYEGEPELLIVDYLTLLETDDDLGRVEAVGKISRSLKRVAVNQDIPVVALAQLRRPTERVKDKLPSFNELRESGNIEQDADTIILIHMPESEREHDTSEIKMIVDKNRNGSLGMIDLLHNKPFCRITEKGSDVRDMANYSSEFEDW